MSGTRMLLGCALLAASLGVGQAQAQTTLRMTWYSDGNEGEVMSDLLRRFEQQNKDIKVVLDQVPSRPSMKTCRFSSRQGRAPTSRASRISAEWPATCWICGLT